MTTSPPSPGASPPTPRRRGPPQRACDMRVLVAPDKFKGSLSAAEVADAVARGLTSTGADAVTLPLADGGDGSVAAALTAGFGRRRVDVRDAGNVREAEFALREGTAVVEVANTCGLATLTSGRLAPMTSSSYAFGQAVLAARQAGAPRVVLAPGGNASTDRGARPPAAPRGALPHPGRPSGA